MFLRVVLFCFLFSVGVSLHAQPEEVVTYRVGITSFRDKGVTLNEWQPTMDYLSARVRNSKFVAMPMNLSELSEALHRREIDFVITNPEHYIALEYLEGVSRVATQVKKSQGKLFSNFGGVIFTLSRRADIQKISDLRGKRVSAVDASSFAGFLLQDDELLEHGVDIHNEVKLDFLGFPQDLCVYAVLNGKSDVGFVRTGVLEAMAAEKKISLDDIKILTSDRSKPYPFLTSTRLYPEWPFAVAKHVPYEVTNQVVSALMLMPPGGKEAQSAKYDRWITPLEYQSVQALMVKHKVYPFDQQEKVSWADIYSQYSRQILLGLLFVLLCLSYLLQRTWKLNTLLKASKEELKALAYNDVLTGLPNRRIFEHDLERVIADSQRTGQTYALALLDLDGFKPINDQLGHAEGDRVLIAVGQAIKISIRAGDAVARWGGDEFVLLFSYLNGEDLEGILDRLLKNIGSCIQLGQLTSGLSASVGVVACSGTVETAKLLACADKAMYQAKQSGGHCYLLCKEI